jgi:hypothetical protein
MSPKICMIGLGYIGLPTATLFASRKIEVVGVDVLPHVVDTINQGRIHIVEPELDMLVQATVTAGYLRATTTPEPADAFLVAVPTPFSDGFKPDLAYVHSAAVDDRFRTEPPFKLQGSYRNMAKLAAGIVSVMTPDELERLIDDHYKGESQTLTTGAEANVLKLAELRGRLSDQQAARWSDIKKNFERIQLQGDSNDPATRVAGTLASLTQRIDGIATSIDSATERSAQASERRVDVVHAPAERHASEREASTGSAARDDGERELADEPAHDPVLVFVQVDGEELSVEAAETGWIVGAQHQ